MTEPRFRIVVPTWRRAASLGDFLVRLAPQLRVSPDFRLTVVNDGSHGEDYARAIARFDDVTDYLILPQNAGMAAARLAGIARATEDYVVSTDDDCRPGPFWLDWIRAIADAHPLADIIAGQTDLVAERPTRLDRLWHRLPNATPASVVDEGLLLTAVGANSVYRRAFLEDAAAPEVTSRHLPEDYHLTQRALRRGASYIVARELRTGHLARAGLRAFLRAQWRYGFAAAEYAVAYRDAALLRRMRCGPRAAWREGRRHGGIVAGLARLAMALGWQRGLRRFGKSSELSPAPRDEFSEDALRLP